MATINATNVGQGANSVTSQALSASDDFLFKSGSRQVLQFTNNTASTVTINLLGDEAGLVTFPGTAEVLDLSTGYEFTILDGEVFSLSPESIKLYLKDSNNTPLITSDVVGVDIVLYEL